MSETPSSFSRWHRSDTLWNLRRTLPKVSRCGKCGQHLEIWRDYESSLLSPCSLNGGLFPFITAIFSCVHLRNTQWKWPCFVLYQSRSRRRWYYEHSYQSRYQRGTTGMRSRQKSGGKVIDHFTCRFSIWCLQWLEHSSSTGWVVDHCSSRQTSECWLVCYLSGLSWGESYLFSAVFCSWTLTTALFSVYQNTAAAKGVLKTICSGIRLMLVWHQPLFPSFLWEGICYCPVLVLIYFYFSYTTSAMILHTHLSYVFFVSSFLLFYRLSLLQVVSYSLEILPYGMRAKGFAIMVRSMCI